MSLMLICLHDYQLATAHEQNGWIIGSLQCEQCICSNIAQVSVINLDAWQRFDVSLDC
jgi:hypothetical protein